MDIPVFSWIIKKLKKSIAIVEEGSTASQAISSGKYVMWKGNLCKASGAIGQGATLSTASGGNLTAINEGLGGEVKDLADQIGTLPEKIQVDYVNGLDITSYNSSSNQFNVPKMGFIRIQSANTTPGNRIALMNIAYSNSEPFALADGNGQNTGICFVPVYNGQHFYLFGNGNAIYYPTKVIL